MISVRLELFSLAFARWRYCVASFIFIVAGLNLALGYLLALYLARIPIARTLFGRHAGDWRFGGFRAGGGRAGAPPVGWRDAFGRRRR